MRSSNPALGDDTFTHFDVRYGSVTEEMTISGVINKTALLLLCVMLSAGWVWGQFIKAHSDTSAVSMWMMIGAIGGLIFAIVTIFKKDWAAITAPIYALLEGLFIGGISAILEASYPGIVIQAAALTFGTLFVMLGVYRSGIIPVTDKLRIGIVAATGGIALVYFIGIILSLFGINVSFIYGNSWFSIAFSLVVVVVAALNFVLDFDFIEQGVKARAPKYMEWYGAFALMVTLIWLYVEFLRLLSKLRSR